MKDSNIQLWCEDEVHFQRHSGLIRMWASKGQQPHVPSASTRQKVGYFGALNLKAGCLLTKEISTFNAETFGDFPRYILQRAGGRYILSWTMSGTKPKIWETCSSGIEDRLVRILLPPYSPELNPAQRVWRLTRRQVTRNRYFDSNDELEMALTYQFAKWERPNSTLRALCAHI